MVAPTVNLNNLPFLVIVNNDFRKVEDRRMDLRLSFQFVEKHDLKLYQLHYFPHHGKMWDSQKKILKKSIGSSKIVVAETTIRERNLCSI
jgi:hypothetical protein